MTTSPGSTRGRLLLRPEAKKLVACVCFLAALAWGSWLALATGLGYGAKLTDGGRDYDSARSEGVRHAVWSEPEPVPLPLDPDLRVGRMALSPDGDWMVWSAERAGESADLYAIELDPATRAPRPGSLRRMDELDTPAAEEAPAFGGAQLYFVSDRPGGQGGLDLYCADFSAGRCENVRSLAVALQSSADDTDPAPFPTGDALAFASNRAREPGAEPADFDLYVASSPKPLAPDPNWNIEHLAALCSTDQEREPACGSGGRALVFASDRAGGSGRSAGFDLFRAELDRGAWLAPRRMSALCGAQDERAPLLADAGFTAWFMRAGEPALWRAHSLELYERARSIGWMEAIGIALLLLSALLAWSSARWGGLETLYKCALVSLALHLLLMWWLHHVYLRGQALLPQPGDEPIRIELLDDPERESSPPTLARAEIPPAPAVGAAKPTEPSRSSSAAPVGSARPQPLALEMPLESQPPARAEATLERVEREPVLELADASPSTPDIEARAVELPALAAPAAKAAASVPSLESAPARATLAAAPGAANPDLLALDAPTKSARPRTHPRTTGAEVERVTDPRSLSLRDEPEPPRAEEFDSGLQVADSALRAPPALRWPFDSGADAPVRLASAVEQVAAPIPGSRISTHSVQPLHEAPRSLSSPERVPSARASPAPLLREEQGPSVPEVEAGAGPQEAALDPGLKPRTIDAPASSETPLVRAGSRQTASARLPAAAVMAVPAPDSDTSAPGRTQVATIPRATHVPASSWRDRAEDARPTQESEPAATPAITAALGELAPPELARAGSATQEPAGPSARESSGRTADAPALGALTSAAERPDKALRASAPPARAGAAAGTLPRPELRDTAGPAAPASDVAEAGDDAAHGSGSTPSAALAALAPASTAAASSGVPGPARATPANPNATSGSAPAPLSLPNERPSPDGSERGPQRLLDTPYRSRFGSDKSRALEQGGGSEKTEQAVARGLAYLASVQTHSGLWGAAGQRDAKYGDVRAGKSGLALLAFLGAGHTQGSETQYAPLVQRAVDGLLALQDAGTGHFGASEAYGHGIATYALAEDYALTQDERLREPLERAVAEILRHQDRRPERGHAGGWSYYYADGRRFDDWPRASITAWQVMALESAQIGGLDVPAPAFQAARRFLLGTFDGENGWFRYNHDPERTQSFYPTLPGSTPAALFGLSLLGESLDAPRYRETWNYVLARAPGDYAYTDADGFVLRGQGNLYFWYYGTLACFRRGGSVWQRWNAAMQASLLPAQSEDGSWRPIDPYAETAGDSARDKSYTTALCVLSLEIYYRYFTPLLKVR